MMDCTDIGRFLHAYIDQEFEQREEIEFEHHLRHCDSCREEVAYYRALRRTMREQVEREVAPVRLEASILHALDEEENESRVGWFSLSLATAGAFMCALGIFLWAPAIQDMSTARQSIQTPQAAHRRGAPSPVITRTSTVVAPLSSRPAIPTRRVAFNGHRPSHVVPSGLLQAGGQETQDRHAARAVLSTQWPQRCVEHRRPLLRKVGWFVPTNLQEGWRNKAKREQEPNQLDDLCDPPRRLIRANFHQR